MKLKSELRVRFDQEGFGWAWHWHKSKNKDVGALGHVALGWFCINFCWYRR